MFRYGTDEVAARDECNGDGRPLPQGFSRRHMHVDVHPCGGMRVPQFVFTHEAREPIELARIIHEGWR